MDSFFRPCNDLALNTADLDMASTSPLALDPATFTGFYSGLPTSLQQSEWKGGVGDGVGVGGGVRVGSGVGLGFRLGGVGRVWAQSGQDSYNHKQN